MGDYTMYINGSTVKAASINGSDIKEIRNATTQVVLWRKPAPNYFYFEDRSGAANSISIAKTGGQAEWLSLEYSTDKETWSTWDFSQTLTLPANGKVYLRGDNTRFSVSGSNYHYFGSTGDVYAGGSVISLYNKQAPNTINSNATMFGFMFNGMTTLVGVDTNLFAGINYGSSGSWRDTTNMFYRTFSGCSSLVTPPDLSGLGYAKGGTFRETFNQCTSLTTAAAMNVTDIDTSATNHFRSAYYQCYALVDASPMRVSFATASQFTLYQTFTGSNNLVTPPDLTSITTLGNQSLYRTFYGCNSLTSLRVGFTQWGSETSTDSNYRSNYQWTYNINTNGTFHCPVALPQTKNSSDNTTSSDFIPYNWVIDTEIPEPNYFYFEDRSGAANSISITKTGDQAEWLSLEYSTDKSTWTTWDFSQTLTLPANGKVYLRGNNTYGFGFNVSNYHTFDCTGDYSVGGDVWSIMSENVSVIPDRFGCRTFQGSSTLVDISNLSIPNMPIGTMTFTWMFAGCTNLTTVMENIPVSYYNQVGNADNSHFYMMFTNSNKLSNFPKFPNITRLNNAGMREITGAEAPNVNITLTYVDLENIETVYTNSLYGAFNQCQALEVVKIGISEWGDFEDSTSSYYNNTFKWVRNVHSTGVFCKNATLPVTRGINYIPNNWSIADLNGKLYAPVITNNNNTISIEEAEGGASCQIYYTTDGTTPTPQNGTLYTQPFTVGSNVTVKAITHYNGVRADLITDSDVTTFNVAFPKPMLTGGIMETRELIDGYYYTVYDIDMVFKTNGVSGVTYRLQPITSGGSTKDYAGSGSDSTYNYTKRVSQLGVDSMWHFYLTQIKGGQSYNTTHYAVDLNQTIIEIED